MTTREPQPVPPDRLLYSIAEARQLLGNIGRTSIWRAIRDGQLTPVRIGRRVMLSRAELERLAGSARGGK